MAALADTVSGLITKYVQICKDVSTDSQLQSKNRQFNIRIPKNSRSISTDHNDETRRNDQKIL